MSGSTREPQGMHFAAQSELRNWTCVQTAVQVLVVHHVVKGEARVLARRGQNLKESAVTRVVGVPIAAAIGITSANPGLQHLDRWLPSGLSHERARTLREAAPGTGLPCTPEQKIELAGICGVEYMSVVRAPGCNLNLARISRADRGRAIISFQNQRAVIDVAQREHA